MLTFLDLQAAMRRDYERLEAQNVQDTSQVRIIDPARATQPETTHTNCIAAMATMPMSDSKDLQILTSRLGWEFLELLSSSQVLWFKGLLGSKALLRIAEGDLGWVCSV